MVATIMSAPQKAVMVQECADMVQDYVRQVQDVRDLETYVTFDPIYGMQLE